MAANRMLTAVGLFCGSCAAVALAHGGTDGDAAVLDLAKRDFLEATADLGEAVTSCSLKGEKRTAPVLDQKVLAELGAEREDVLIAVGHLSFRNTLECEKEARHALFYAAGTLTNVIGELNLSSEALGEIERVLIYPPLRDLEYRVKYRKLDVELRKYLEKAIGDQPYDLIPALEENGLLLD